MTGPKEQDDGPEAVFRSRPWSPAARWLTLATMVFAAVALWLAWKPGEEPPQATFVALLPIEYGAGPQAGGEGLNVLLARELSQRTSLTVVDAPRIRRLLEAAGPDEDGAWVELLARQVGADYLVRIRIAGPDFEAWSARLKVWDRLGDVHTRNVEGDGLGRLVRELTREVADATGTRWRQQVPIPVLSEADESVNRTFTQGMSAMLSGDTSNAADLLSSVLGQAPDLSFARYELANAYRTLGESDRAKALYEEVIESARNHEVPNLEGAALAQLGVIARQHGDPDRARELHQAALERFETAGHALNIAHARGNLGLLAESAGDLQRARILYGQALLAFRRARDRGGESATYSSLAVLTSLEGDLRQAREYQATALAIQEELGLKPMMIFSLTNLGELDRRLGRFGPAENHLERAAQIAVEMDDPNGMAGVVLIRAALDRVTGRLDEGRQRAIEALEAYRSLSHPDGERRALTELSRIELAAGRAAAALDSIDQALAGSGQGFRGGERGTQLVLRARIALALSDPARLQDSLEALDEVLEHHDNPDLGLARIRLEASRLAADDEQAAESLWREVLDSPLLANRPDARLEAQSEFFDHLLATGRIEDAGAVLERITLAHPHHPGLLQARTRFYLASGDQDAAALALEKWRQRHPRAWRDERGQLEHRLNESSGENRRPDGT